MRCAVCGVRCGVRCKYVVRCVVWCGVVVRGAGCVVRGVWCVCCTVGQLDDVVPGGHDRVAVLGDRLERLGRDRERHGLGFAGGEVHPLETKHRPMHLGTGRGVVERQHHLVARYTARIRHLDRIVRRGLKHDKIWGDWKHQSAFDNQGYFDARVTRCVCVCRGYS